MIRLRCLKLTSIHDWRTSYRTQRADRYTEKSHFSFDLNSLLFKFTKGEVERTLESPVTRRVPALSHHQSGPVAPVRDLVLNTPEHSESGCHPSDTVRLGAFPDTGVLFLSFAASRGLSRVVFSCPVTSELSL